MENLTDIARRYPTDKADGHSYTGHYDFHFSRFRKEAIKLLEIGIGGYGNPSEGGGSLKMWRDYFESGHIYAFDISQKFGLDEERITTYQGNQIDDEFLNGLCDRHGEFDIIVDDGSHVPSHVIHTFNVLFPRLKNGGIYVVEDIQTSYWRSMGGDLGNPSNLATPMNYFKSLCDGLNHKEYVSPGYQPTYFDTNITSIHFYHNLVFIYKGDNTEESNVIKNNVGNSWAF